MQDAERERVFLVCQIIRVGRMDLKDVESKKQAKGMRRPFGVAAVELTDVFRGGADSDEEKQLFVPFLQLVTCCFQKCFGHNRVIMHHPHSGKVL